MSFSEQLTKVETAQGFIAALDQSGGSTPRALAQYGIEESEYDGEDAMFDLVHEMRTRIISSPSFDGDRILGAILFEGTMQREIDGMPTSRFLWERKSIVPFLKVDLGLADVADGVQVMKPIPTLGRMLDDASANGVFGTKMRSVVKEANAAGVDAIVDQQFEVGAQIMEAGLVPILEPEIDIHAEDKRESEDLLLAAILERLAGLSADQKLMFKLSLPNEDDFYRPIIDHPNVVRTVALSGGYSRDEANALLARNPGLIASFSRALVSGLSAQQSAEEFDGALGEAIASILAASIT